MPRKVIATKEEKLAVVLRQREGQTVYALARQTGYPVNEIRKWIRLYREKGEAGLENRKFPGFLLSVLLVLFAAMSVIAVIKIQQVRQERAVGNEAYANLAGSIVTVQPQVTEIPVTEEERQEEQQEEQTAAIDMEKTSVEVDFDALQAITAHSVGWILSDDGLISYPVVQGTDNDYYLNHLPDGTVNRNGSIFMDFRNRADLSDRNTFIYGHNMLDGTMFASLSRYSEADYRMRHPELLLMTPDGSFSLQVFAGCVVPGHSDLYQLSYRDDEEFITYIDRVRSISDFTEDVPINAQDKIVTLSTCSYNYDDARYLLFCKLVPVQ